MGSAAPFFSVVALWFVLSARFYYGVTLGKGVGSF
jgi:hypothetical protein